MIPVTEYISPVGEMIFTPVHVEQQACQGQLQFHQPQPELDLCPAFAASDLNAEHLSVAVSRSSGRPHPFQETRRSRRLAHARTKQEIGVEGQQARSNECSKAWATSPSTGVSSNLFRGEASVLAVVPALPGIALSKKSVHKLKNKAITKRNTARSETLSTPDADHDDTVAMRGEHGKIVGKSVVSSVTTEVTTNRTDFDQISTGALTSSIKALNLEVPSTWKTRNMPYFKLLEDRVATVSSSRKHLAKLSDPLTVETGHASNALKSSDLTKPSAVQIPDTEPTSAHNFAAVEMQYTKPKGCKIKNRALQGPREPLKRVYLKAPVIDSMASDTPEGKVSQEREADSVVGLTLSRHLLLQYRQSGEECTSHRVGFLCARVWPPKKKARTPQKPVQQKTRKDTIEKQVRRLLNVIAPQNVDVIVERLGSIDLLNAGELECVIRIVFGKALADPHYCNTYANMVLALRERYPEFPAEDPDDKPCSFTRLLLNACQDEFEHLPTTFEPTDEERKKYAPDDLEEMLIIRKQKMLANMKFIGHLFMRNLLATKIMSKIVHDLIGVQSNGHLPEAHMIECVCELLRAIGSTLESTPVGKTLVLQFIARMKDLKMSYQKRIQFRIQDVVDLQSNNWRPRNESRGRR